MVTEMLLAVFKDNPLQSIQTMIASGDKIDVTNDNGDNILHFAAFACNLDLLKWCLSQSGCPDINSTNNRGVTPLMSSCIAFDTRHSEQTRFDLVSYLCQLPCINLNLLNSYGYSADEVALENGFLRISDYIKLQMLSSSLARAKLYLPSTNLELAAKNAVIPFREFEENEIDIVCYDRLSCN